MKLAPGYNPNDWDVVWSGSDPLIPDRESQYDGRWDGVPVFLDGNKEIVEPTRPKRRYMRTGRYARPKLSTIQPERTNYIGQAEAKRGESGGQQSECVSQGNSDAERTIVEV